MIFNCDSHHLCHTPAINFFRESLWVCCMSLAAADGFVIFGHCLEQRAGFSSFYSRLSDLILCSFPAEGHTKFISVSNHILNVRNFPHLFCRQTWLSKLDDSLTLFF